MIEKLSERMTKYLYEPTIDDVMALEARVAELRDKYAQEYARAEGIGLMYSVEDYKVVKARAEAAEAQAQSLKERYDSLEKEWLFQSRIMEGVRKRAELSEERLEAEREGFTRREDALEKALGVSASCTNTAEENS